MDDVAFYARFLAKQHFGEASELGQEFADLLAQESLKIADLEADRIRLIRMQFAAFDLPLLKTLSDEQNLDELAQKQGYSAAAMWICEWLKKRNICVMLRRSAAGKNLVF